MIEMCGENFPLGEFREMQETPDGKISLVISR